jgi:hypothetical protein
MLKMYGSESVLLVEIELCDETNESLWPLLLYSAFVVFFDRKRPKILGLLRAGTDWRLSSKSMGR